MTASLQLLSNYLVAILGFQSLVFLLALIKKNNGIADIAWGIGFIIISLISCLQVASPEPAHLLICAMVTIWGLRLSGSLFIRNYNKPEDWRYAQWRQSWGKWFVVRSYLQVFILQGVLMLVIGSPIVLHSFCVSLPYSIMQYILIALGCCVWLLGFYFQAIGDYQLFQFKKEKAHKGKVMRYGLWQYTRHPNYFGEACMWWGIFTLSCTNASMLTDIALRMIGPCTITFLLLRVSGVTMLEQKYNGNEEYLHYQRNTSSFIPWRSGKS